MLLDKSARNITRNTLNEIDKKTSINKAEKRTLFEELTKILNDLKFKKEHIKSAYDSSSYYGLKDLEYTLGDLDDY